MVTETMSSIVSTDVPQETVVLANDSPHLAPEAIIGTSIAVAGAVITILAIFGLCLKRVYRANRQLLVQLKAVQKQISEMTDLSECDRDKWNLAINQFGQLEMAAERDPGELYA